MFDIVPIRRGGSAKTLARRMARQNPDWSFDEFYKWLERFYEVEKNPEPLSVLRNEWKEAKNMAKKAAAKPAAETKPEATLQSIVSGILDREGTLKLSELAPKVKAIKSDAKEPSIGQCLHKWKKAKGIVGQRTKRVEKPKLPRGTGKAIDAAMTVSPDALLRASALAKVIDIPVEKLSDVLKALS